MLYSSIRILPHKQNSGGFFVAVLLKKHSLRDGQNSSKPCVAAVSEPVSDECTKIIESISECAVVADQPTVTQNNSKPLDLCSRAESNTEDSAITAEQPVADNSIRPGWFSFRMIS